jgi:hypothetical protein
LEVIMPVAPRTLVPVVLLVASAASVQVSAQAPDPLIGTWILNLAQSQYEPGTAPKSEIRNFDYSRDGMILCTFQRVSAQGSKSFGHWLVKLDGEFYPELQRSEGTKSTSSISLKKTDDRTLQVNARRNGAVYFWSTMQVSADGRQLTWKIKTTAGEGREISQVRVYDKE